MKERLKMMGILDQAGAAANGSDTEGEPDGDESDTDSDSGSVLERDDVGDRDFKPPVPPDFTDPEGQIFGASGRKSFPVPDFKGLTGVKFPSEQTLLAGLQGDVSTALSAEETESPKSNRTGAHGKMYELDNVEALPLPLPPPPVFADADADVDADTEASMPESATGAATMPPAPPTLSTREDQVEKELLAKAADCRKVMDQMIRLSLQATEMYSSLQAMRRTASTGASTDGTTIGPGSGPSSPAPSPDGFASPKQSYDGLPMQSVFSPRGGHKTIVDGSSTVHVPASAAQSQALTEVDKVLHDLRKSMASLSALPGGPITTPAAESPSLTPVAPSVSAFDEDAILAKYSDRLAEMVSEKVAAKMSVSLSLSRSMSATHASAATSDVGGAQDR
jgi:hypothetical protein